MYIAISLLYWPVWFVFIGLGSPILGMFMVAFTVCSLWSLYTHTQFGVWNPFNV